MSVQIGRFSNSVIDDLNEGKGISHPMTPLGYFGIFCCHNLQSRVRKTAFQEMSCLCLEKKSNRSCLCKYVC